MNRFEHYGKSEKYTPEQGIRMTVTFVYYPRQLSFKEKMMIVTARKLLVGASFMLLGGLPGLSQAQNTAATIPASFHGTWTLSYFKSSSTSAIENGAEKTFVFTANNELCFDDTVLAIPVLLNGNPQEATWTDSSTGYVYSLSSLTSGFNEVNVGEGTPGASGFTFHGQFTGSKTSDSAVCSGASSGSPSISADAQSVLDLALEVYPTLFGQGGELKEAQGYVYRFFASSGIYVGFKDGRVYVVGGPFGDSILDKGTVSAVTTALNTAKANIELNGSVDVGGNGEATGELWDITISGTASVLGVTTNIGALTVENVTSTNPASEEEIEKIIEEYFKDYGTITNLEVVIVNNTSDKVTLDLAFKGAVVSQGFTVNTEYNLRYEFNKK